MGSIFRIATHTHAHTHIPVQKLVKICMRCCLWEGNRDCWPVNLWQADAEQDRVRNWNGVWETVWPGSRWRLRDQVWVRGLTVGKQAANWSWLVEWKMASVWNYVRLKCHLMSQECLCELIVWEKMALRAERYRGPRYENVCLKTLAETVEKTLRNQMAGAGRL